MRDRRYHCGVCKTKRASTKGSLCPRCAKTMNEMITVETRQMVKEVAIATSSVIQDLQNGVIHCDANTNRLLTDPADIVLAVMEDRLILYPPMSRLIEEYPHLANQV